MELPDIASGVRSCLLAFISCLCPFVVVEVKAVNQAGKLVALGEVEVVFPD
jgi:hypothetical protein